MKVIEEIILHAGMHKTGTSSIQMALKGYDHDGIRYANVGLHNHSIALVTLFAEKPHDYHIHQQSQLSKKKVDEHKAVWQSQLENELLSPAKRLIFSGEDLTSLHKAELEGLRNLLLRHATKIRMVAYIREPVGFISSAFQEGIKNGRTDLAVQRPEYRQRFEKLIDVFGRGNIEFIEFSKHKLLNACAVADFCTLLGIPELPAGRVVENKGLSGAALRLLHLFNQNNTTSFADPASRKARGVFLDFLVNNFPGRFVLKPELIAESLDVNDIRWMETVSGFELFANNDTNDKSKTGVVLENEAPEGYQLADDLNQLSPGTIETLKGLLVKQNIAFETDDSAAGLIAKLYNGLKALVVNKNDLAVMLRNLALRMEQSSDFSLQDAQNLMRLAMTVQPNDAFTNQKVREYEELSKYAS